MTVWQNGFSVDDGETPPQLLTFQEHEGRLVSVIESMKRGEVPREFRKYGQDVDMHLDDKRDQEFAPPKKTVKSFTGAGFRLGAPTVVTTSTSAAPIGGMQPVSHTLATPPSHTVDETQPVTKLQLRLADGTRLVARFNLTHSIADVRRFIQA